MNHFGRLKPSTARSVLITAGTLVVVVQAVSAFRAEQVAAPRPEAASPAFGIVGQVGGPVTTTALGDETADGVRYAYVGTGTSLVVYDVADPAAPREVGRVLLPGSAVDLARDGDTFVVAHRLGMAVLDLHEPASPRLAGGVPMDGGAGAVAVGDGNAFVAATGRTLGYEFVVDVRDPDAPVRIGPFGDSGPKDDVAYSAAFAYASGANLSFQVFDAHNPARLEKLAELNLPEGGAPGGFAVAGNTAYLSAGSQLLVYDLSDHAHPQVIGRLDGVAGPSVAVSGPGVYVVRPDGQLQIVDVEQPTAPRLVGSLPVPAAAQVTVAGRQAFVSAGREGLWIVDITNPSAPRVLSRIPSWDTAEDVVRIGPTAFVAAGASGLVTVDAANAARLRTLAVSGGPAAYRIAVDGSIAYTFGLLSPTSPGRSRLVAYDVSDPAVPQALGTFDLDGRPTALAAADGVAYLGESAHGLHVVDANDPSRLHELAGPPGNWRIEDLLHEGRILFVADMAAGLRVVDVSDPARPTQVGGLGYFSQADSRGFALAGGTLFTAGSIEPIVPGMFDNSEHAEPILAIDVSDPGRPRFAPGSLLGGPSLHAKGIVVESDRLLAASGTHPYRFGSGLPFEVLMLPTGPSGSPQLPPVTLPDIPRGVASLEDGVLVADGSAGLLAVRLGHEAVPTPTATLPPHILPTPSLPGFGWLLLPWASRGQK
jgi:hypothetical protein